MVWFFDVGFLFGVLGSSSEWYTQEASELHLKNALEGNKSLKELSESYLGFVVIKPIKDKDIDGNFLNF